MRTIIAGSRTITDASKLQTVIDDYEWPITTVLCGGAQGVDKLGEQYALAHNIPIEYYPADWKTHGKAAGPIRNSQMAENAEALILIWDGQSRGSKDMLAKAQAKNLKTYVYYILPEKE